MPLPLHASCLTCGLVRNEGDDGANDEQSVHDPEPLDLPHLGSLQGVDILVYFFLLFIFEYSLEVDISYI